MPGAVPPAVAVRGPGAIEGVCSVFDLVTWRARETPDALMAVDERGVRLTFAGYRDRALAVAAGLAARGVGAGTVVSWQLPTWVESMVLCGALARVGAVQVPLIPSYRGREVGFILRQSGAELYVGPTAWGGFSFADMAREVAPRATELVLLDPAARALPEADPETLGSPPGAGDADGAGEATAVRWLYYTSGTTGEPKGARHSDTTLFGTVPGMLEMLEPVPSDRNAMVFPFAHVGGVVWLLTGLTAGNGHILAERFDPAATIPMLAANGVTLAGSGTPFNLAYLAAQRALAAQRPGARVFPAIRHFMSGASPKPPSLHAAMRDECGGSGICSSYGMTEAPILTCCGPRASEERRASTEGHASPGVVLEVLGADGAVLGSGVEGEVVVRGPQVCHGYVDPALDVAFDELGRLHTGDLGVLDDAGYLTVTGRLKDVIIRKGENISAKEIEDLLFEHPKVGDVAVIGLPDPDLGEMACAVVAPAPGAEPLGFDEMVAYLKGRQVMTQKIPERLEIVDLLPRNAASKVMKQALQARFGPGGS